MAKLKKTVVVAALGLVLSFCTLPLTVLADGGQPPVCDHNPYSAHTSMYEWQKIIGYDNMGSYTTTWYRCQICGFEKSITNRP